MIESGPVELWRNARLASLRPQDGAAPLADGAIAVRAGRIAWAGALPALPAALRRACAGEHDLGGALVTPGLIDCHTHLVYAGDRSAEFERRLQGATYAQIAAEGGGIRSTVRATRAADEQALFDGASRRLSALLAEGVCALEVKSGYGLDLASEERMLRVARRLGTAHGVTVRTSYLGAHALPEEYAGRADDYIGQVCAWMPRLHEQGLVDAVDAFCDPVGFDLAQTAQVLHAARALGLDIRLHAGQFGLPEGVALAASLGALSCDHLEHLDEAGMHAMARSGTVAVLLPGAFHFLRETRLPPVARLRALGIPIAIATDHNPGSSPVLSLLLTMSLACTHFGLTPWEALQGVTVHAARALGAPDRRGLIDAGEPADFVVWDAAEARELCYWLGARPVRAIVRAGRPVDAGSCLPGAGVAQPRT